jgi:hypothetical protein
VKSCPRCLQVLALDLFPKNATRPDGLGTQCRACKKKSQSSWYQRHRERHMKNVARRNKERRLVIRSLVRDYLASHPCADCGEADPVVLEFDHVRGSKVAAVATLVANHTHHRKVWAEIAKCDVRCANCHRRRHARLRITENANEMETGKKAVA